MRGLSTGGKFAFQNRFTVFSLFYFVFECNFQVRAPRGAYIRRGDFTEGILCYEFGGLIHGGAYFRNFTVCDLMRFNDHRGISRFFCEQGSHSLEKSSNFREGP